MQIKALSWNIWISGYFDQIASFLKTSNADIIGLQEVKDNDPNLDVINYLTKLGYQHVFAPIKKVWGKEVYSDGPAIFSKHKIQKTETYVLSKNDSRAAVRTDIQIGNDTLHVFSLHLVHTHQKQTDVQDQQVANLIKILPSKRTIVMGDFNATPKSSVIQNMQKVLVDADPSSAPTWSNYSEGCTECNPQSINTKLDYIFTSRDLKTTSFKVESSKGSDHLPISTIIKI